MRLTFFQRILLDFFVTSHYIRTQNLKHNVGIWNVHENGSKAPTNDRIGRAVVCAKERSQLPNDLTKSNEVVGSYPRVFTVSVELNC